MITRYQTGVEALLKIATSEELFELLGRVILFPGSSLGGSLIVESEMTSEDGTTSLQLGVRNLAVALETLSEARQLSPSVPLVHAWVKTFKGFQIEVLPWSGPGGKKKQYAVDWMLGWGMLGVALGRLDLLMIESPECSYPRCAAPKTPLIWGCAGCKAKKLYCSRKCQQADWTHTPNPHKSECGQGLGENDRVGGQMI